ncbi:hypothetical protein [Domibacillus tundrae]|uniref:hypothetical protein n=1 Tax=Domibacillus tundrae TaxID=1587527 RepID=UPI0006182103|nr:hypothetical protein [Domibacillus tundrae]
MKPAGLRVPRAVRQLPRLRLRDLPIHCTSRRSLRPAGFTKCLEKKAVSVQARALCSLNGASFRFKLKPASPPFSSLSLTRQKAEAVGVRRRLQWDAGQMRSVERGGNELSACPREREAVRPPPFRLLSKAASQNGSHTKAKVKNSDEVVFLGRLLFSYQLLPLLLF